MLFRLPISSNIRKTASLAPPCFGPYNAAAEPAIHVYTSTPLEARWRTNAVEQFNSCSACNINNTSKAWTNFLFGN